MKKLFYIFIPLTLVFHGFQCNDEDCEEYIFDTASLNYSIEPFQKEFEIGDTISIKYLNKNLVMLHESTREIDLTNREILQYFDLFQVKENNLPITSGTEDIQIIHNGNQLDYIQNTNEISRLISWNCEENDCSLIVQLIPRKSGFYGIRLLHGLLFGEPTCEEYEFKENSFNVSGNNLEILNEIGTTEINIDAPIKFDQITISEGSFYFEVK